MKNISIINLLLIVSILSCSKSEDSGPSNAFTTKGKTFTLSEGYIQDYGGGTFWVVLADGAFDSLYYAAGHSGLSLFFKSPDASSLVEGEYAFTNDETLENREFYGEIYLFDSAFFVIDSGTVVLSGSGTSLNFDIDVRYNNIQSLSGIYNGTLTEFDDDDISE